jgi:hypothetical protein
MRVFSIFISVEGLRDGSGISLVGKYAIAFGSRPIEARSAGHSDPGGQNHGGRLMTRVSSARPMSRSLLRRPGFTIIEALIICNRFSRGILLSVADPVMRSVHLRDSTGVSMKSTLFERLVPTSGSLLAFALAGFVGGCGPSRSPAQNKEISGRIAKVHSQHYKELKAAQQEARKQQSSTKRGHGGRP